MIDTLFILLAKVTLAFHLQNYAISLILKSQYQQFVVALRKMVFKNGELQSILGSD